MIVLLLFWVLFCISEGYEDARYDKIFHFRAVLRRMATGLVVGYLACGVGAPVALYISVGLMLAFVFWVVFDISRNLSDGEAAFYIGKESSIDKRLRKAPLSTWLLRFLLTGMSIAANWFAMDNYMIRVTNLINQCIF
jgi:hypothetical protein